MFVKLSFVLLAATLRYVGPCSDPRFFYAPRPPIDSALGGDLGCVTTCYYPFDGTIDVSSLEDHLCEICFDPSISCPVVAVGTTLTLVPPSHCDLRIEFVKTGSSGADFGVTIKTDGVPVDLAAEATITIGE